MMKGKGTYARTERHELKQKTKMGETKREGILTATLRER